MQKAFILVLLGLLLVGCGENETSEPQEIINPPVNESTEKEPEPEISNTRVYADHYYSELNSSDWKLLYFTSTWCLPCQEEIEVLQTTAQQTNTTFYLAHFRDEKTTPDHTFLADRYTIILPQTKLLLKNDYVLIDNSTWTAQTLINLTTTT